MNRTKSILISGAGIAGPALAHWLVRHGLRPTVVERASAPRDGGYAVDFRGAAHLGVLERMGILGDVRRAATKMGVVSYVDKRGKQLSSMPTEVMSGDVEILRGDLVRILHEATRSDVEYVFDDSVTAVTQADERVTVTFDRSPARTFDLVVGADGLHSTVRALAFGDESRFIRHLGYYVAIFTTANHLGLEHTGRFYNVPGKLAGIYSARENTEAKAMLCFASQPLDYDARDLEQQRRLVTAAFAGEEWEVPRLLDAMPDAPDFYFDSISQIRMDRWCSGRTALLGDAAYCASPLSGMGSGLAVVGAYVLAGELAAAGNDHRAAFARYEARMRDYVTRCQKSALPAGRWFVPRSRPQIWLRNQNFRMLAHAPWKGVIAAMSRKTANAIVLADYRGTGPASPIQ